jgi:hypothetical protein
MTLISSNESLFDQVERLIRAGADSLFAQHRHSIGYLLGGDDDIVEANIVFQIGAAFLSEKHAVWAESPFKVAGNNFVKHMDLLVDLHPGTSEHVSAVLLEAKRLLSSDGTKIIKGIIRDSQRVEEWPHRLVGERPLFFEFTQIERTIAALVVLLPDEPAAALEDSEAKRFSDWWQDLEGYPGTFDRSELDKLKSLIEPMKRGICTGPFVNDGIRQVVVYALSEKEFVVFDEDLLTAKHESAHVVVANHFGLPIEHVSVEEYESATDTALNGRMVCDWESLKDSRDPTELCKQAFAVSYAGAWLEAMERGWPFQTAYDILATDQRAAAYARGRLLEWTAMTPAETIPISEAGAELAKDLVMRQFGKIERLAAHLVDVRHMEGSEISGWFSTDSASDDAIVHNS